MTDNRYDQVDYGGNAQGLTAPNHVGAIARMLGLRAASPRQARVLELGCGNGANLLALAWYWPQAEFVGLDLAHRPIEQGRAQAETLGLKNLSLRQADVATVDRGSLGRFDYVIAHGLFSWVPTPVRTACLALIADVLTPNGVAYVSYNAYPGCRMRHLVRELMQFHLGVDASHDLDTARRGRELLTTVTALSPDEVPEFFEIVHDEARRAAESSLNYLFHDDLAQINQPYYLHEFCALAGKAGLTFLGDADTRSMFEPESMEALGGWLDRQSGGDPMRRQQYLDFALGTRFRRTLLCRADAAVAPAVDVTAMDDLRFWSPYLPASDCVIGDDSTVELRTGRGHIAKTNNSVLKLLFTTLAQSPARTVSIDEFAPRLAGPPQPIREGLRGMLARLIRNSLLHPVLEAAPAAPVWPAAPDERPAPLSRLSRLWLQEGRALVDNLHQNLQFDDPITRELLAGLDGTLDAAAVQARFDALRAARPEDAASLPPDASVSALLETLRRGGYCGTRPGQGR